MLVNPGMRGRNETIVAIVGVAMSAVQMKFDGGGKLRSYLASIQSNATNAKGVRVGFLEDADYPASDGSRLHDAASRLTPQQEADHPSWKPLLSAWARWADQHHPQQHVAQVAFWNEFGTTRSPARPFFRHMISAESPSWGEKLGASLKGAHFDARTAFTAIGTDIKDALTDSITSWPADNAPLTVHIKQFNRGLTDGNVMKRATDFEVMA